MERVRSDIVWLAVLITIAECQFDFDAFEPNHPSVNMYGDGTLFSSPLFHYTEPSRLDEAMPIIIWWTGRLFMGDGIKQIRCPNSVCYSTSDRSYMMDLRTRGFYFYGTDLDPEDMPLPRKPHHEWALFHEESPMNNYMLVHNTMLTMFNHTSTFRRESDYPITSNALVGLEYLTSRKPLPIIEKNRARKEGIAPVLYMQSHCNVASDRDRFVKELMKHIDVDSVGACLHNKDIPKELRNPVETMDSPELYSLISKYKFHIAYENAICKDYMTEKLFRPLHVGSVPVYKGSSRVRDWLPDNKSAILIDDFSSPEDLAKYLKYLDENDEEYELYLHYKTHGVSNTYLIENIQNREWGLNEQGKPDSLTSFECYICDQLTKRYNAETLHQLDPSVQLLPQHSANTSHLNCPQPYPSIGDIENVAIDDKWQEQMWIEDYWSGLDKAEALREMVEKGEEDPKTFVKYWRKIQDKRPQPISMP